jgi:hypothetical protein
VKFTLLTIKDSAEEEGLYSHLHKDRMRSSSGPPINKTPARTLGLSTNERAANSQLKPSKSSSVHRRNNISVKNVNPPANMDIGHAKTPSHLAKRGQLFPKASIAT